MLFCVTRQQCRIFHVRPPNAVQFNKFSVITPHASAIARERMESGERRNAISQT